MNALAIFSDWAEMRDAVMILAGIGASLVALVFLLATIKLSLTAFRVVRRLERFHERRLAGSVATADARLQAWLEEDRWSASGIWELVRIAAREVEARRKPPPPPKRRFFGILPPSR